MSQQGSMLVVSTQLRRNAGPNLGLPSATMGEAYMRVFPQVTDRLG